MEQVRVGSVPMLNCFRSGGVLFRDGDLLQAYVNFGCTPAQADELLTLVKVRLAADASLRSRGAGDARLPLPAQVHGIGWHSYLLNTQDYELAERLLQARADCSVTPACESTPAGTNTTLAITDAALGVTPSMRALWV